MLLQLSSEESSFYSSVGGWEWHFGKAGGGGKMIKLETVGKNTIVFSSHGCADWLYLTPKETFDSIKELRKGLFAWHELAGEPVEKSECH